MHTTEGEFLFVPRDGAWLSDLLQERAKRVRDTVDAIPEAQFVNTSEATLVEHVAGQLAITPLVLHKDRWVMETGVSQVDVSRNPNYGASLMPRRGPVLASVTRVTVRVPFSGNAELWKRSPNSFGGLYPQAHVRRDPRHGVHLELVFTGNLPDEEFKKQVDGEIQFIEEKLAQQRSEIASTEQNLPGLAQAAVRGRLERLRRHAGLQATMGIPLAPKPGAPLFLPLEVRRQMVRPLPPAPTPGAPPEYGLPSEMYEHILSVIRHEGRTAEALPATYRKHEEEELRDLLLVHLNGHYDGAATGEAFRNRGKTDIRIEHETRAAFVAECKLWRGPATLGEACDQLTGYLTWRDCKGALVVYNTTVAGFTDLRSKVAPTLAAHPRFLRATPLSEAGEWRVTLCAAEDPAREIIVHVFLFNLWSAA